MPEVVEVILEPRCFYIMAGKFRYLYSHAILGHGQEPLIIPPADCMPEGSIDRRISVMFRDEAPPESS